MVVVVVGVVVYIVMLSHIPFSSLFPYWLAEASPKWDVKPQLSQSVSW